VIIHKKTFAETENGWCIILNPVRGELAKNQAVDKISQSFSISQEEAYQLIESAPVLLLEDLTYGVAQKIRDYFSESKLDCFVTNDPLQKRKCFRAVWNEEPRLNFFRHDFLSVDPAVAKTTKKEALSSDQAIAQIREEINGDQSSGGATNGDGRADFQKKYEALSRQYALLVEDKLIQEKKIGTLEQEIRFLRDKENSVESDLKAISLERENLLHELEALRVKNALIKQQAEVQELPQGKKILALEEERKAFQDRFQALQKEYDDAEKVWIRKFKAKEEERRLLETEQGACQSRIKELTEKLENQEKTNRKDLIEQTLGLREEALKELVRRQEDLEREITEKETLLKSVFSEQERLEKEIVRAKQLKNQV